MHADPSHSARRAIRALTGPLQRELDRRLRETVRETVKRAQQAARENARAARERARREAKRERNMVLAIAGAQSLIALGTSDDMQQLLALRAANASPFSLEETIDECAAFSFYRAVRPSGDAWETRGRRGSGERVVSIELRRNRVLVGYGSPGIDWQEFSIPYAASLEEVRRALHEVAHHYRCDVFLAARKDQYEYEWDHASIIFAVFMTAATKAGFRRLLKLALNPVRSSLPAEQEGPPHQQIFDDTDDRADDEAAPLLRDLFS